MPERIKNITALVDAFRMQGGYSHPMSRLSKTKHMPYVNACHTSLLPIWAY